MYRLAYTIVVFLNLLTGPVFCQEKKWTLEDCINYAITNNLQLQRQKLVTETREGDLLKSRMDFLPSLNLGSDARIGFGRSIDPVTNLITFKQNISNSYSLTTSFTLFTGFTKLNSMAANKYMLLAGIENEKLARNNLIIEILGQYYQVLYSRGLEEASKMQMELSERQLFRITRLVETGREALSKQFEMESQYSADRLAYTIAFNNASQALTSLKQMLQLEPGTGFDIFTPALNSQLVDEQRFSTDSVYKVASATLPRLRAIEYELAANRRQVSAALGNLSPSLSVGGSVFTGYYKVISDDVGEQLSFNSQLKNNNSQSIFFSLDIPIFNNYTTGRNIRNARIRKSDTELRLELEKNTLFSEIENACLNYTRGRDEYLAAQANLEFNKKSFDGIEKKFEAGLVDVTDYSAAKTTLFSAEAESLRTRLQLIIRRLTINFYTTGEYENLVYN